MGALLHLAREILEESKELGIPTISIEDGMILMSSAFHVASAGGKLFVDAGAGIGFSTLWIAAGISGYCEGCEVIAIEMDETKFKRLAENLKRVAAELGVEAEMRPIRGDALSVVRGIKSIDYIFVDIEKPDYPAMLELLESRLTAAGTALFHNAITPRPPEEFFQMSSSAPWRSRIIPTAAGMMVLRRYV